MDRKRSRQANRARSLKRTHSFSRKMIIAIALTILTVVGFGASSLYVKNQDYIEQEIELMEQLAEEQQRTEEIEVLKEYTQTDEYVEEVAREKLGLVYEDEIIFRAVQ